MFLSGKVNDSSIHYLDTITSHKILKCFITYDRKRKKFSITNHFMPTSGV